MIPKKVTELLDSVQLYAKHMASQNKPVTEVTMFADDFDTVARYTRRPGGGNFHNNIKLIRRERKGK